MSATVKRLSSNKLVLSVYLVVAIYVILRLIALYQNKEIPLPGDYFTFNDKQVRYVCEGSGTPYVILETGFGSDSEVTWSSITKQLPNRFTTCYYDRLGYGGSDNVPTTFTTEQKSQLQESLIQHIAGDHPVIIVAKSYGGIIARRTAARGKINLAAMIFLDSAHENQHTILSGRLEPISDTVKNFQYLNAALGFSDIMRIFKTYDSQTAERIDQYYSSFKWANVLSTYRNEKGFYTPLEQFNYDFGDLKLVVLSQDKEAYAGHPRFSAVVDDWAKMQESIAKLSDNSEHIVVKGSTHNMTADAPDVVVSKIVDTVAFVSQSE